MGDRVAEMRAVIAQAVRAHQDGRGSAPDIGESVTLALGRAQFAIMDVKGTRAAPAYPDDGDPHSVSAGGAHDALMGVRGTGSPGDILTHLREQSRWRDITAAEWHVMRDVVRLDMLTETNNSLHAVEHRLDFEGRSYRLLTQHSGDALKFDDLRHLQIRED